MDTAPGTIIWVALCLVALVSALWRPGPGRVVFAVFFIVTAVGVDVVSVLAVRNGSTDLGTAAPLLSPWWVLERVVAEAPVAVGLLVASYAVATGLLMMKSGRWGSLGLIGGIVLLLVVGPLGPWAAANLVAVAALGAVLVRDLSLPPSPRGVEPASSDAGRA